MRVAAVDCGTNTLRLLVLERTADDRVIELDRRLQLVRLGQGVDATGEFAAAALQRTFAALEGYAREIAALGVERVRFVATSAARDVTNTEEFLVGVQARLGVSGEIITGAEEAALTFAGALAGVPNPAKPVLVTDIGGGSTELVVGTDRIERAMSIDVGSVRVRERYLDDDPPTDAQLAAAIDFIDEQLDLFDLDGVASWIGVAGTVTSMAAVLLGLTEYDRTAVQGLSMSHSAIDAVTGRLCTTAVADLISPVLPPLRAEVIAGGALICSRIAARVDAPMIVSENDLLDGVAHGLLEASASD